VLIIGFLVAALAKPWGGTPSVDELAHRDGPSPNASLVRPTASSSMPSGPPPSADGGRIVATDPTVLHLALAGRSAPVVDDWAALDWTRVDPGDAAPFLTRIMAWSGGYVALASRPDTNETIVWTSVDGTRWTRLPVGTAFTFWPGSTIVGLTAGPGGLVAAAAPLARCPAGAGCTIGVNTIASWASGDGTTWSPGGAPDLAVLRGPINLVAAPTPAGLALVATGRRVVLATTSDGKRWTSEAVAGLDGATVLSDAASTTLGLMVVGLHGTAPDARPTAWLQGNDGQWIAHALAGVPGTTDGPVGTGTGTIAAGPGGVVVHVLGTTVDPDSWWQSADGRSWRRLPTAPRRGPWLFGIGGRIIGDLVVGDGSRIVALRGGDVPVAWISSDGWSWRQIAMRGDLPSGLAQRVVAVPGGLLVSDGESAWLGVAASE
jgi:hypothetical protein